MDARERKRKVLAKIVYAWGLSEQEAQALQVGVLEGGTYNDFVEFVAIIGCIITPTFVGRVVRRTAPKLNDASLLSLVCAGRAREATQALLASIEYP